MVENSDEMVGHSAHLDVSAPVSWPLVERRRGTPQAPPDGVERRDSTLEQSGSDVPTLIAAPLWPFRVVALGGAIARTLIADDWRRSSVIIAAVAITVYTIVTVVQPVPYRDESKVRLRIVIEFGLIVGVSLITGAWASPFALCLVPAGMLAGFAAGGLFSVQIAVVAVAAITVQHVDSVGVRQGLRDGALWAGLLGIVGFTSGLAHRAALDSARQQQLAHDRVSMLAEANSLLFALQRVAQTLPASLDLDEVLDSTVGRLTTLVEHDALAVLLFDREGGLHSIRAQGLDDPPEYNWDELPPPLRAAVNSPRPIRRAISPATAGTSVSPTAKSGLYAALRARGALVGVLAVESDGLDAFSQQQVEIIHGLTEPFGIAIDNARMFRQIRTLAADEERSRIARDLHDHIGSSLATIGFEVDRAVSVAHDGQLVEPMLRELRSQVSAVVVEVRETLYDLRTDVTETKDLGLLLRDFLPRVERRSGIVTTHRLNIVGRLPVLQEREVWQVVREAITNVERHSQAHNLNVTIHETEDSITAVVRDDGIGLGKSTLRADSYGHGRDARASGSHRRLDHYAVASLWRNGDSDGHARRGGGPVALTVMLVDDHMMLRQGLRRALESEGIEVVAEASDGAEAVKMALDLKPDVVLMDVTMPSVDGVEATKRLVRADARQRVVMLTMHIDRDVIDRSIRAGAVGYLTKDSSIGEVIMAIKLAANGDRPMSPRLAAAMLDEARKVEGIVSHREEEVLQLIADGFGTNEIAERLYLSQKTVKNHLASIYDKLNARDRTQAVLTAVRMGIVKLT